MQEYQKLKKAYQAVSLKDPAEDWANDNEHDISIKDETSDWNKESQLMNIDVQHSKIKILMCDRVI